MSVLDLGSQLSESLNIVVELVLEQVILQTEFLILLHFWWSFLNNLSRNLGPLSKIVDHITAFVVGHCFGLLGSCSCRFDILSLSLNFLNSLIDNGLLDLLPSVAIIFLLELEDVAPL